MSVPRPHHHSAPIIDVLLPGPWPTGASHESLCRLCHPAARGIGISSQLHLHKSHRIFGGESAHDAAPVSWRLRRAGPPQATMVTALTSCYAPRGEGGNAK